MKGFIENWRNYLLGGCITTVVVLCDQITKWYVLEHIPSLFITSWLRFYAIENYGMSWGLMHETFEKEPHIGLGFIGFIIFAFLLYTFVKTYEGKVAVGEFLVLGGAVSNYLDRLYFGAVRDFIQIFFGAWSFPIFNIADVAIVGGVLLILLEGLLQDA